MRQVSTFYPTLHLDMTAGDAGLGYYAYLHAAYCLGVKRVVDLRAHETDKNKDNWTTRGYDNNPDMSGRLPLWLCPQRQRLRCRAQAPPR